MSNALFADISHYQVAAIGTPYWAWSKAGDGAARLACKATEGVGYKDANFEGYWTQALANNAAVFIAYHFARPDLNAGSTGAANEAKWLASVLNNRLRPGDRVMLDFERNESATWAHAFHDAFVAAYSRQEKLVLYDSLSRFNQFFASDSTLAAKYDAALAAWHSIEQGPPAAPKGWKMLWWQYSNQENVPGIGSPVDANVWYGGAPIPVPPPVDLEKVKADLNQIISHAQSVVELAQDALKVIG